MMGFPQQLPASNRGALNHSTFDGARDLLCMSLDPLFHQSFEKKEKPFPASVGFCYGRSLFVYFAFPIYIFTQKEEEEGTI